MQSEKGTAKVKRFGDDNKDQGTEMMVMSGDRALGDGETTESSKVVTGKGMGETVQ